MIASIDLWHKDWGFGFTLCICEELGDEQYPDYVHLQPPTGKSN